MEMQIVHRSGKSKLALLVIIAIAITIVFVIPGLEERTPLIIRRRGIYHVLNAQTIFRNPKRPCDQYKCKGTNSELKVCKGEIDGVVTWALSWVYNDGIGLREGLGWTWEDELGVKDYIKRNGCR
jgi:hypothetical protein